MENSFLIGVYLSYSVAAIGLTVWLARTLFKNGAIFLDDVFNEHMMAEAVNRLLVVGFYMLNLGYAFLIFKTNGAATTRIEAVELLVSKLGVLLVSLGVVHFLNIFVFWRIRDRSKSQPPPIPVVTTGAAHQGDAWA